MLVTGARCSRPAFRAAVLSKAWHTAMAGVARQHVMSLMQEPGRLAHAAASTLLAWSRIIGAAVFRLHR